MSRAKISAVVRVPDGWLGMNDEQRRCAIALHLEALAVLVRNRAAGWRSMMNVNGNTTRIQVEG